MTHKEILEKAIQKALDGGWSELDRYEARDWWIEQAFPNWTNDQYSLAMGTRHTGPVVMVIASRELLLSHDFAKALWGDAIIGVGDDDGVLSVDEYFKLIGCLLYTSPSPRDS